MNNHKPNKVDKKDKQKTEENQQQIVAEKDEKTVRYQSFAIISMMGDFIHNFTDGLSIGVAY